MKIVRIIARLNIGGPAIQAVLLTQTLTAAGHTALLVAGAVPEGEGDMRYFAEASGVQPVFLNRLSRKISTVNDLRAFVELYRLLRRERPDLVHTHTAKAGTLGRLAAWLTGTPRVHTFHGHVFRGYFSPRKTRCVVWIERSLARITDRIVAISASQRREIAEEFAIAPASKVEVVRLGFDLQPFLQVAAARADRDSLTVGWVGRLTEIKNPLQFVELAGHLAGPAPSLRFRMVGDGNLRPAVEQAAQRQALDNFEIVGWQREMAEVYAGLDILALTSHNEGTPVAVIEAMASGCCVVAADVGGVRDLFTGQGRMRDGYVIHDNGILVCDRRVPVFAAAVRELAADAALRRQIGQTASHFADSGYGCERLTGEILAVYQSVLEARTRRAADSLRTPRRGHVDAADATRGGGTIAEATNGRKAT